MEPAEIENKLKGLSAEASALRGRRRLKNVLIRLRQFLQEHREVLRSMSDDTHEALRSIWRH
jgi:hypothetical protein